MKKLAVITVTYNRKEYCEKAVAQLQQQLQESPYDYRIFIYDNASEDGTVAYLKALEQTNDRIEVLYGSENLGTAGGYLALLNQKVFDAGFDFILKNDDDELLPEKWWSLLDYWDEFSSRDVLMAGFRRPCTQDYFSGLEWVSRDPEHVQPLFLGDNECYLSYITVGPQIAKEEGWQLIAPQLSDYGEKFGGWDVSVARAIKSFEKKCLVVYNKECIHFQKWEDHPEYTQEKMEQIKRVRERLKEQTVSA